MSSSAQPTRNRKPALTVIYQAIGIFIGLAVLFWSFYTSQANQVRMESTLKVINLLARLEAQLPNAKDSVTHAELGKTFQEEIQRLRLNQPAQQSLQELIGLQQKISEKMLALENKSKTDPDLGEMFELRRALAELKSKSANRAQASANESQILFTLAQLLPIGLFLLLIYVFRIQFKKQENARALLEQINSLSPSMIYVFRADSFDLVYRNARVSEFTGIASSQFHSYKSIQNLIHPDDKQKYYEALNRCQSLPQGDVIEVRYRVIHQNGSVHWIRDRMSVFAQAEDGSPLEILGIAEDITRFIQSEDSNKILVDLVDHSPDVFVYTDALKRPIYVNRAGHRLGWTPAHQWITDFVAPESKTQFEQEALRRAESGQTWVGTSKLANLRTGQVFEAQHRVFAISDSKGIPQYYAMFASDMTDENRLKRDLEIEKQRIDLALKAGNMAVFDWNVSTNQMSADDLFFETMGAKREAFQDPMQAWLNLVHPDDRKKAERDLQEALSGIFSYGSDYRIIRQDRTVSFIRSTGVLVNREDGSKRLIGLVWDITPERELEAKVRESESQLNQFIQDLPASVALFDRNMKYLATSKLWLMDHGLVESELATASFMDLFPTHQAEWDNRVQSALLGEVLWQEEESIVDKQGKSQWFKWVLQPAWHHDEVVGFIVLTELITDKKRMAEQLEISRARQITSSRLVAMGEMAAGIAHEINNPLSVISGRAQSILMRLEDQETTLPKEQLIDSLKKINVYTERIASIIRGLKAFSRDGSADPMNPATVNDIVSDTVTLINERFKNRGVALEVVMPKEINTILCRPVQISQIISNLVTNAFDAIKDTSAPWIKIEAKYHEGFLEVRVHDNGPGISDELAQKIFQPFFTTKEVGKGTGLGLSISMGLAKEHGGSLELDRSVSKSCFLLRIPIAPDASQISAA